MPLNQSLYNKTVFIDTNAIIAFGDDNDPNHEEALKVFHFFSFDSDFSQASYLFGFSDIRFCLS
jgi:hypothetical protein